MLTRRRLARLPFFSIYWPLPNAESTVSKRWWGLVQNCSHPPRRDFKYTMSSGELLNRFLIWSKILTLFYLLLSFVYFHAPSQPVLEIWLLLPKISNQRNCVLMEILLPSIKIKLPFDLGSINLNLIQEISSMNSYCVFFLNNSCLFIEFDISY